MIRRRLSTYMGTHKDISQVPTLPPIPATATSDFLPRSAPLVGHIPALVVYPVARCAPHCGTGQATMQAVCGSFCTQRARIKRLEVTITVPSTIPSYTLSTYEYISSGSILTVRGQSRTQAIRGWPGPSVDGLVSVDGLAFPTKTKTF